MDQVTQKPKGFGFVTFESEVDALEGLDGKIVDGRLIFIEVSKNAAEMPTNTKAEDHE